MTIFFVTYIMHRWLGGVRNGMIYDGGHWARNAVFAPTIGLWVVPLIAIMQSFMEPQWRLLWADNRQQWSVFVSYIALGIISYMAISRIRGEHKYPAARLHTWTFWEQVFALVLWVLLGWKAALAAILATYPALIAQKVTINLFSGLKWNDERTDDPTGKTYGLPIFGIVVKVPRIRHYVRMSFAILSVVVFFVVITYEDELGQLIAQFNL